MTRFAYALALTVCLALPATVFAQAKASALKTSHDGHTEYPLLSPDGTQLTYEVNIPGEKRRELYMVGFSGRSASGDPEKLVPESMASSSRYGGGGNRVIHGFAWAATGKYRFAYTVSDNQGMQDIYIDNWSQMVEGAANKNANWDPNAARFVFSSGRTGNGDLYLWDGDQGGLPLQLTFDDKNGELYPAFDSSGSKVVYVRAGRAGSHIFVLDVNMFSSMALVQWDGSDSTRPSFSPDGSKVAFFSNKGKDSVMQFGLWVTDSRPGSSPRNIGSAVRLPSKGSAQWTPDGKGVIAVMDDPDAGDPICIFPVDGGSPNCLDTGTRVNRDPMLAVVEGQWRLIYAAQQVEGQAEAKWMSLFVYDIPR